MRQLNEIVPQHFNMLLFAVNPPAALIPPMPAPQGDRTSALLTWAEASGGCGLSVLEELLDRKSSPIPPSSSTVNSKLGQDPGTSFEPYPVPVLADPKKIVQALDTLRDLKSFVSAKAVNTTTGPQLPR
jgi:Telomere resolvase